MREEHSTRFSNMVRETLIAAGWFPGRRAEESLTRWMEELVHKGRFEMFSSAKSALLEFGELRIDQRSPGEECAREPISLDPLLAMGEEDRFEEHSAEVGEALFPLGEAIGGHMFLAIGKSGRVFLVMQDIWLVGESIDDALAHLIRGVKPSRLE